MVKWNIDINTVCRMHRHRRTVSDLFADRLRLHGDCIGPSDRLLDYVLLHLSSFSLSKISISLIHLSYAEYNEIVDIGNSTVEL